MTFAAACKSVTGTVRLNNEDAFVVGENLIAVADGVGGRPAGEVASAIAVAVVRAAFDRGVGLEAAVHAADEVVRAASFSNSLLTTMVCTLTAATIDGSSVRVAQVGDSRAYLASSGSLTLLTVDQTMAQKMIDEGKADKVASLGNPKALSEAVGGRTEDLQVKITELELSAGDRLLLCTDGLSGYLSEADMLKLLDASYSLGDSAEALVQAALDAASRDNVTVIVAELASS